MLGRDPYRERNELMRDVCFIADVAVLPPWLKASQALDYVGGVHPRFDRAKAEGFLAKTSIPLGSRVHKLSKGMITQLHLALVMAIDAKLLVLDEPTLGLDILYRKQFYDTLLNDYFDHSRTILVTTHQVEEIQHVLTDVMFMNKGRLVLDCTMEDFENRYVEVMVKPEQTAAARALKPLHERQVFGRSVFLFDASIAPTSPRSAKLRTPSIADLFVAMIGGQEERRHERSHRRRSPGRPDRESRDAAALLARAARAVGEPLSLHRAARRGGCHLYRLSAAGDASAGGGALLAALDPERQRSAVSGIYGGIGSLIVFTMAVVTWFYALDALHSERRDRSILFWKSLPVSDTQTVLSKLFTAMVIAPLIALCGHRESAGADPAAEQRRRADRRR